MPPPHRPRLSECSLTRGSTGVQFWCKLSGKSHSAHLRFLTLCQRKHLTASNAGLSFSPTGKWTCHQHFRSGLSLLQHIFTVTIRRDEMCHSMGPVKKKAARKFKTLIPCTFTTKAIIKTFLLIQRLLRTYFVTNALLLHPQWETLKTCSALPDCFSNARFYSGITVN